MPTLKVKPRAYLAYLATVPPNTTYPTDSCTHCPVAEWLMATRGYEAATVDGWTAELYSMRPPLRSESWRLPFWLRRTIYRIETKRGPITAAQVIALVQQDLPGRR